MKKNISKEKQLRAIEFLANHPNPIIRQHAKNLVGGGGPIVIKPTTGTDGMYPPDPFPIDL
jgi:hypothetical protein